MGIKYTPDMSRNKLLEKASHASTLVIPMLFGTALFREYAGYYAVIAMVRVVFTAVTILPKHKNCNDSEFGPLNLLTGHCYDKIFSGHFAVGVLLSLMLYDKGIVRNAPLLILLNFMNAWVILSLRFHYSIDLVVAALVATVVYQAKWKF